MDLDPAWIGGYVMTLAQLRGPPLDLDVGLSGFYTMPTAFFGHHPRAKDFYRSIKAHLEEVNFGCVEIPCDDDFSVKAMLSIRLDCANAESFDLHQGFQVAVRAICGDVRIALEGTVKMPWGYAPNEVYPSIVAGLLTCSRKVQDVFAIAEASGGVGAVDALAKSVFIIDYEYREVDPLTVHDGNKTLLLSHPARGGFFYILKNSLFFGL